MAFVSTAENGGVKDPKIGPGRPKGSPNKKVSRRSLRDKELMSLLRKLRPHISDAIMTAVKIMKDKQASETNRLRAVAFLQDQYHKLLLEVYEGEEYQDGADAPEAVQPPEEIQPKEEKKAPSGPVFSLRIVGDDSKLTEE